MGWRGFEAAGYEQRVAGLEARVASLQQAIQSLLQAQAAGSLDGQPAASAEVVSLGPPLDWEAAPEPARTPWAEGERWPTHGEIEEAIRSLAVKHGQVSSSRVADSLARAYGFAEELSDLESLRMDVSTAMVMLADGDGNLEITELPNGAGECSALLVENDWLLDRVRGLGDIAPDVSGTYRQRVAEWLRHKQYTERGYSAGLRYEQHVRGAWRSRRGRGARNPEAERAGREQKLILANEVTE